MRAISLDARLAGPVGTYLQVIARVIELARGEIPSERLLISITDHLAASSRRLGVA